MPARVCAWASWAEWRAVYHQITSPLASERELGIKRIGTWRTRGRLPVAVDVTGSFVEVMLNDPELNAATTSPRSEHELRLMYSMTVVRLVNGIVDVAQRRANVGSIAKLAQEMDWPQWFVDLRHEATHQKLPSLPLLRIAAKEALWLLFERFWKPQLKQLERRGRVIRQGSEEVTQTRDQRFIDKRLRVLVKAAYDAQAPLRKASSDVRQDAAKETPDKDEPVDATMAKMHERIDAAAREVAALAIDESRLLARLKTFIMAHEPNADRHQIRAVHALCAFSSENFSLRLIRDLVGYVLNWSVASLEPTTDNAPSLRNICDVCTDRAACADDSERSFLSRLIGGTAVPKVEGQDEKHARMLQWLEALLAPQVSETTFSRFLNTFRDLVPMLRRMVFRSLSSPMAGSDDIVQRAMRVLQILDGISQHGVSKIGKSLSHLCSEILCSSETATDAASSKISCRAATSRAGPTLDDIEALLQSSKRRRTVGPGDGSARPASEPWTAVGTILDRETLEIKCRPERGGSNASLTNTLSKEQCDLLADAFSAPDGVESAASFEVSENQQEFLVSDSKAMDMPEACEDSSREDQRRVGEAEFRERAAALFSDLQPLDFVKKQLAK